MNKFFQNKRVLITGANGFIGASLVKRLEGQGAEVFAVIRDGSDLYRLEALETKPNLTTMDLRDREKVRHQLSAIQPEFVFNTAVNRDYVDVGATVELNTLVPFNLLEASLSPSFKSLVHCGSFLEYGDARSPFDERDMPVPSSLCGSTKAAGTILLQGLASTHQVSVSILRLFHVYGPLEPANRLIPTAIRSIRNEETLKLTEPGLVHDPVFIEDVLDACLLAARITHYGEIINIASGKKVSNEALVQGISDLLGQPANIQTGGFPKREWDRPDWFANIAKAENVLGWHPNTSLKEGLKRTIGWHIKYGH